MSQPAMTLIGIEEHFLTPEVMAAWHAIGLDAVDPSVGYHQGAIGQRLADLADERIALMDETGLDVEVLSLTTPALHDLGSESVELARRTNDAVADAVARHPARFQALATLPVAMPEEAALELERCVSTLGFKGTMLCGRVGPRNLDDPAFAPILDRAARLGVPVLLHPRTPPAAVRDAYYSGLSPVMDAVFATAGLGWHYDAGVQFLRLVLSGTFDRLPSLQVILGHWGELVLFYAERLAVMDRFAGIAHPIAHYLRHNLHVTASGMFLPHYLQRAMAIVGVDRLLFSTDYPYQHRPGGDARRFLAECGLDDAGKAAFAHGNWQRLTGGTAASGLAVPPTHRPGRFRMAKPPGALSRAVARMIAHRETIVCTETLADGFVAITLEAPGFRNVTWTRGAKAQIAMGSVFETRTYTPIAWDAARGRTRIFGFLHGDGPGAAWLRGARMGDTCDVLGPRHSLDLRRADGPIAFFGDETSIGLACALSQQCGTPCSCHLEAGDAKTMGQAAGALGLNGAHVAARTAGDGHLQTLMTDLPSAAVADATFILTGRAHAIQRLKAELKILGVPSSRTMSKAYWAPGKVGLD